jgi:hypothetical protein
VLSRLIPQNPLASVLNGTLSRTRCRLRLATLVRVSLRKGGRPSILPFGRAFARPDFTRSAINDLSNCATMQIIWSSISPLEAKYPRLKLPTQNRCPAPCQFMEEAVGGLAVLQQSCELIRREEQFAEGVAQHCCAQVLCGMGFPEGNSIRDASRIHERTY